MACAGLKHYTVTTRFRFRAVTHIVGFALYSLEKASNQAFARIARITLQASASAVSEEPTLSRTVLYSTHLPMPMAVTVAVREQETPIVPVPVAVLARCSERHHANEIHQHSRKSQPDVRPAGLHFRRHEQPWDGSQDNLNQPLRVKDQGRPRGQRPSVGEMR